MVKYIRMEYEMMQRYNFGANPNHRLSYAVIQRGAYGAAVAVEELMAISRKVPGRIRLCRAAEYRVGQDLIST